MEQWVYDFAEGSKDMRELLGGKGANVAEMTRVLGADRVPAGLHDHHRGLRRLHEGRPGGARGDGRAGRGGARAPAGARRQAARRRRGPAAGLRPLRRPRVDARDARHRPQPRPQRHVRRGPRASATENERFAWDSYRRFVQMFGNVSPRHRRRAVRGGDQGGQGRPRRQGRHRARRRRAQGARPLQGASRSYRRASRRTRRSSCARRSARCSTPGPASARSSTGGSTASPTSGAPRSTSSRWCSATRATRRAPASRSAATRSPARPSPAATSCANAQGEDVVSGVRNTRDIAEMKDWLPEAHEQLMEILRTLEKHYEDMQDTEFTVRGRAAVHAPDAQRQAARRRPRCASRCDAVDEELLDQRGGADDDRRRARSTRCCTRRSTPRPTTRCSPRASARRPGAAKGEVVFTAAEAVEAAAGRAAT